MDYIVNRIRRGQSGNRLRATRSPLFTMRCWFSILIVLWAILTFGVLWPFVSILGDQPPNLDPPDSDGVNYLVITPQALEKSASAWADYRRNTGYQTHLVLLTPGQSKADVIQDLIQKTYLESGKPHPFYVLLMGHAHPFSSYPETFLPAAYFSVDSKQFSGYGPDPIASDDGFVSDSSSETPRNNPSIFIGRLPVRTEAEAFLLLDRTRQYEESPPTGSGRAHIELVSANAGFGSQYDPLFDWALKTLIQEDLPAEYGWHLLNGNPQSPYSYPMHLFPDEVARRFASGALALVYVGHAQPDLLGWACTSSGACGRIFGDEDAGLIQHAGASLAIFTACSAGKYDLPGDDLSVVEKIFLTPGGPVATYSSSAWINAALNGRLLIDLSEALLIDRAPTLGAWVGQIESSSSSISGHLLLTAAVRSVLPMVSGLYEKKLFLAPAQANQVLAIQHATYNLFGDPALWIAYLQPGMEVRPDRLWLPHNPSLGFHGTSSLPAEQQVSISLEMAPGDLLTHKDQSNGTIERYLLANQSGLNQVNARIDSSGQYSGSISIPPGIPSGRYLLKAIAVHNGRTYGSARPVYLGWPPIREILSSAIFWWITISLVSGWKLGRWVRAANPRSKFLASSI